ncbi:VCBS repeat protein [Kribbella antiqua]|uniref:VCBS repeat protein n=1 Tax=Kribbella antiqua TaxID=2512217 RepID=A0A4R2IKI2_9ACTN|nr:FG-GAP-like repeat-containing protein [Kribbella antiqua]TCO45601.1 VCBS repeat protein [Kribbella antiqua]
MKRRQLKLGSAVVVSLGLVVGGVVHVATADTTATAETPPENGSVALSTEEVEAATPAEAGGTMQPATTAGQPKQTAMAAEQAPAASAAATLAKTGKLKIKGVYQSTNYWCVPASSAVSLGTFGVSVSQSTLAKQMKTTTSGTYDKTALPVINSYINPLGYSTWDANTTDSATNLLNWAAHDIGILKRAPKIGVWMEKLPWNKGMKGHYGHAILIYGYDLNKKTLTVWDPWKPSGGTHTLSAATLNKTMQEYGLSYVSAHSDVDLANSGDLSGDGRDDMVAVDRQDGALYRYTNNGKGAFSGGSSAVKLSTGWNAMKEIASVGDLTGDGKPDLVAVEKSTGKLWLFKGPTPSGSTRVQVGASGWNGMRDLTGIGNIIGDSHQDLIAIEKSTGKLWAYPGKGGGFGPRKQIGTGWTSLTKLTAVGDLSRDGKPDFVAVDTKTGKLWLYKGLSFSGGTKRTELVKSGWNGMRSLTGVGDLNGDKIPDLIAVANSTGKMYLYAGKKNALGSRTLQGSGWNS